MMEIIPWIIQRASEPSTWAGFAGLAVVFGIINAPADGCGWVKPISVAEEDRLTTATKRALLAHNEA